MSKRQNTPVSSRKRPQQSRSADLVATILEAALQVLQREGAQKFTTARVAERAGVSIGSVYQYFPNKAAILFRLQSDEWRQTGGMLRNILQDAQQAPLERLRTLVHAFIRSECEEADIRAALTDIAPLYNDDPEAQEAWLSWDRTVQIFIEELLPAASAATRSIVEELISTTLSSAGEYVSANGYPASRIDAYADALADMFCAYLSNVKDNNESTIAVNEDQKPA
ncbi:TetR family transcriptional regulator [Undibacterium sp. CY18W]|uniref:TetR family transcriptional regulator n=1 Tax=Undibacterium hunanense TaxID=2762292 RepID=A0ABR6ZKV0_9BURK|nr:TetR family transcriptional regulator [Undibacterium hunanense]MBC3916496.1 TetR family transcriptional regulator [Undibacterium hunanense]